MPLDNAPVTDDKFHFIYRITVEHSDYWGNYYYGKHSTNDLTDGYLGSGKVVTNLRRKGIPLVREIISYFPTEELCLEFEEFLVDAEMLSDPKCLNLRTGGADTFTYSDQAKATMSQKAKARGMDWLHKPDVQAKGSGKKSQARKRLWKTEEYREKMAKRPHGRGRSTGYFVTPKGTFISRQEAADANSINSKTLYNRCKRNDVGYTNIKYQEV